MEQMKQMELDEPTAYALATWARFDEAVTDDLLRAVCGAFAIVAAADGTVTETEIARFLDVIRDRSYAFPKLGMDSIERLFRDLSMALLTDPEGGRQHALSEIARIKDFSPQRELVRSAAQIAIFADRRIEKREQAAMEEICKTLGID